MRPLVPLAAALASLLAAASALAVPSVPAPRGSVMPSMGNGHRETATVRIKPATAREAAIAVEVDVTYTTAMELPKVDAFPTGKNDVLDAEASGDNGLWVTVLPPGGRSLVFSLMRGGASPPLVGHLRFTQELPRSRRYGWRVVRADLDWATGEFQVAREVTAIITAPAGVDLPGFECQTSAGGRTCTRVSKHWMPPITVATTVPLDVLGLFLIAITLGGSVFGFEQMRRRRALELALEARAQAPAPIDLPGGAYREPPRKAVGPVVDATEAWRALDQRATLIAVAAIASTIAVAVFAAGHSPWPMAWVTAAWIAIAGLAGSLLIERA